MNRNSLLNIVISMFFVVSFILFSGCTSNSSNNNSNDSSWMNNYTPVHSVGNGVDDFWITFPEIHPKAGQLVSHLSWVLDALETKSFVFVVHKTGCASCQPQADRVIALGNEYWENMISYDLDLSLGGSSEQKGYEAFLYDPNDAEGYIALTGIFTLFKDNGKVTYGWHSWEGDVADAEMETWFKDAIYYYHMNQ